MSARQLLAGFVCGVLLLISAAAAAVELTWTWRQVTGEPFALPGTEANASGDFRISAEGFSEWHLPAPGVLGLALADDVDANEALEAWRSNGSGVLARVPFERDAGTGLWRLADMPHAHRLVHVRARRGEIEARAFYVHQEVLAPPLGARLPALQASVSSVRRHVLDFPEPYAVLGAGKAVRFKAARAVAVRLRLRMLFRDRPRPWQDYRISVRVDDKPLDTLDLRANQDRSRSWLVDGEETLLGLANDHFLELPGDARVVSVWSSHPVLVRMDAVRAKRYLLPAWNHLAGASDHRAGLPPPELARTLAAQGDWRARAQLAGNGLIEDAPLLAAARSGGGSWLVQGQQRERVFSRYTRLQTLLPEESAVSARALAAEVITYQWPALLGPTAVGRPRFSGASMRSSPLNQATSSVAVRLEPGATLSFPAPALAAPSRLRLLADRAGLPAATRLEVAFDGPLPSSSALLLSSARAAPARHDPAALKPRPAGPLHLPPALTGAVELPVPAQTRSVSVRNASPVAVSISLQLRVARRDALDEARWIALLDEGGDRLLARWWQLWDGGLKPAEPWDAVRAAASADAPGAEPWLLLQHYLSEQASLFGAPGAAPFVPANVHCTAGGGEDSDQVLTAARSWQASGHRLNANEAWRRALPALAGADCVDAHQRFAANLVQLGEHQLAEDYWRSLILLSRDAELRLRSIETLGDYYDAQQLPFSAVRLWAYVALRWREPAALRALAGALLDAGQVAFGVDVALLAPDRAGDARLHVVLEELGWLDLLALIEPAAAPGRPSPQGIEWMSPAPAAIHAASSRLVRDRLLGGSVARFVARPDAPLRATVAGPTALRLALRPVHDAEPTERWALVTVDDRQLPVPLSMAAPSLRYELDGDGVLVAATEREIVLGPGLHEVSIAPERGAVVTALSVRGGHVEAAGMPHPAAGRLRVLGVASAERRGASAVEAADPLAVVALPRSDAELQALLSLEPRRAAARQLMATLTYLARSDPAAAAAAGSRAEWLADRLAHDRSLAGLRNRLRGHTRWQRQELLAASAGIHIEPETRFAPDSEHWRVRNLLLPEWQEGEVLVGSGAVVELALAAPEPSALRFELTLLSLNAARDAAARALLAHNGAVVRESTLKLAQKRVFELSLARGEHSLRLDLSEFPDSSLVKLRVWQRADGRWQVLERPVHKRYQVATPEQPVELALQGPAWLRVDQQTTAGTLSRFRYLASGETLPPLAAGADPARRYRVFARVARRSEASVGAARDSTPRVRSWPATVAPVPQPPLADVPAPVDPAATSVLLDAPTYTTSLAWHTDDEAREDVRRAVRDYVEVAVTRREHDQQRGRHLEASAFARTSADGNPSFGTSAFRWQRLDHTRFSLRAHGLLAGQKVADSLAWAAHGQLAARHLLVDHKRRRHRSELKVFARYLSEDQGGSDLDPDVFTDYAKDHQQGAELSHRINVQPTWDAELFGELKVRSNELQDFSVDYLRSVVGARNQLGDLQIGSELQVTRYLADDDRDRAETVPRLKLRGRWYGAGGAKGRLELRGELTYDLDRNRASGALRLLWHFDRRQGLDDFHAERHWFDPLLEQRLRGGAP